MGIGQRMHDTIEAWQAEWKERLKGWMVSWLSFGFEVFFNVLGKAAAPKFKPLIDKIEAETTIPPEIKPILDELKSPQGQFSAMLANSAGGALVGASLGRVLDYILRPLTYGLSFAPLFFIHEPPTLISLWRRGVIKEDDLNSFLHWHGLGDDDIEQLKKVTEFLPSADEQTLWLAREVYEPTMVDKYGLDAELPVYTETDFAKVGVTPEQMTNKWRAHWVHASWMQMVEMLHRGLVTEKDVYEWFRLVEQVPFWRDLLIQTAYTWPTRVDVRRWWDMRTIDEGRLRELYSGMGYRGKNLDDYVLWTKVYVAFPDLMARWKNGWITEDDVRRELTGLGMPSARVDEMLQTKMKMTKPERTTGERELTKTDIVKGVNEKVISYDQGIELLTGIGYDVEEADFILASRVAAAAGSPETFEEFQELVQKYRIAIGVEARPMPEELKEAAKEVVRLTEEVEALKRSIEEEKRGLVEEETLPEETTAKLEELQVSLHRAEAELERVKDEYERLVAEWRHGA